MEDPHPDKLLYDHSDHSENQPEFYHLEELNSSQNQVQEDIPDQIKISGDYDRSAEANYYAEGDEGIPDISHV
jgi:hypothetical protein